MSWIRKLLIIIIFILFSFILFRLGAERRILKMKYGIEGFASSSEAAAAQAELAAIKKFMNTPASTVDTSNPSLPLAQYCIKGAYNAALTGKYINVDMIKQLYFRGCRFLDFEVFSMDKTPYVAMSTDSTYATIDTANKDTLQNILTTVVNYGFVAPSQITKDPVFIHLRIKTTQTALYDAIGKLIGDIVADKRYVNPKGNVIDASGNLLTANPATGDIVDSKGKIILAADKVVGHRIAKPVTGATLLSTMQGKVVVIVDKTYLQPDYGTSKLGHYVNLLSNSDAMEKWSYGNLAQQQYTTPHVRDDKVTTDVTKFRLVTPDMSSSWFSLSRNSVYYPMVMNYGAQVVLYPFYMLDMYLTQYEQAFSDGKAGVVPMSRMMTNIQAILNVGLPPAGAPSMAAAPPMGSLVSPFGQLNMGDATSFAGVGASSANIMAQGSNTLNRLGGLKSTQSSMLA